MSKSLTHFMSASCDTSGARLVELSTSVVQTLPGTKISAGTDPTGRSTLTLRLPNGIQLLASGDSDLPWLLFELVRFVAPGDVAQHPFEGCSGPRYALTDKLSGQEAVALIGQYAQLAGTNGAQTQSPAP